MKHSLILIVFFCLSVAGFGQANKPHADSSFDLLAPFKCLMGGEYYYNSDTTFLNDYYVPLDSYFIPNWKHKTIDKNLLIKLGFKSETINGKKEGKWLSFNTDLKGDTVGYTIYFYEKGEVMNYVSHNP